MVHIHPCIHIHPPTHIPNHPGPITSTGRSTEAAFLTGRYVRIRRKLMLITVLVPTALFVRLFVCVC